MSKQQDMHYKEVSPTATVEHLCKILADMGITMEEQWQTPSVIDTYSLRIVVAGTHLGTNGKGVSKEFARASAYAEFFERFQNQLLAIYTGQSRESEGFRHYHDEKFMTLQELSELDNVFMTNLYANIGIDKHLPARVKEIALRRVDQQEKYILNLKDQRETRPYYNITKHQLEWLPTALGLAYYGSNGMCAGNSPVEALCQGFSEIFERHVQRKMIQEQLCFPTVPDEEVARYPRIWKMLEKARVIPGYKFMVKDCSMGGKFPVAALFVIKEDTGQFGVKFGSHPDFGIAMERTFTEVTQGRELQAYAMGSSLDFYNRFAIDEINVCNTFKIGSGVYPYQCLGINPDYEYVRMKDVSAKTNLEILLDMVALAEQEGYEVWVRDVSYTGFPSYHVVVPGMSELFKPTELQLRAGNMRAYLVPYLNNPSTIDQRVCRMLIGTLDFWSRSQLDNQLSTFFFYGNKSPFPGEEMGLGWLYLVAMGYAFMEDYENAAKRMSNIVLMAKWCRASQPEALTQEQCEFYSSIYQYFSARQVLGTHEKAMENLGNVYSAKMAVRINDLFGEQEKILMKQYKKNDFSDAETVRKEDFCDYFDMLELSDKLKKKQIEHPISQADVALIFKA